MRTGKNVIVFGYINVANQQKYLNFFPAGTTINGFTFFSIYNHFMLQQFCEALHVFVFGYFNVAYRRKY